MNSGVSHRGEGRPVLGFLSCEVHVLFGKVTLPLVSGHLSLIVFTCVPLPHVYKVFVFPCLRLVVCFSPAHSLASTELSIATFLFSLFVPLGKSDFDFIVFWLGFDFQFNIFRSRCAPIFVAPFVYT